MEEICRLLQKSVTVGVGSQSDGDRLFRSFRAQTAKLWTYDRQALVSPHKQQRAGDGERYSLQLERTAPGGTAVRFDRDT